jgi:MFS family permease
MTSAPRLHYALDALNFFLADVAGALGPYLGIFLLTREHWDQAQIGLVATLGGIAGLAVQTPMGALIDGLRAKRGLILAALLALAASAVAIAFLPRLAVVIAASVLMAVAGAALAPAVAAITLGIVGHGALARRLGRNAAFDHAGNLAVAVVAGGVGWWLGQRAVFALVPIFASLAAGAVLAIPGRAIDHRRARGMDHDGEAGGSPARWRMLLEHRPLLIFAGCVALFHFANAAMLPLVGQKLALAHRGEETALMSGCIIAAQAVMVPMALLVAARADRWGRKPLFLVALAVLPLRGVLFTFSSRTEWLLAVQLLDGVGAGLVGALGPLILADLMRGTGRYNASLGVVATTQGLGAALSSAAAGIIVVRAGYSAAFLALAAIAGLALLTFLVAMPETAPSGERRGAAQPAPNVKQPLTL